MGLPAAAAAPSPGPEPGPGTPIAPGGDDTTAPVPTKPGASLPKSPTPRTPDRDPTDRAAEAGLDAAANADAAADDDTRIRSAFAVPIASRHDPYGPRPEGVAQLTIEQINAYALENPAVAAAQANIEAMAARVRKAKFAWVPIIDASFTLAPGVFIECDDFVVD